MAIHAFKLQLHNFIRCMCDEGFVNEQFVQLEAARQHPLRRDALIRAVIAYFLSSKHLFSAITIELDKQQVDFERVNALARDFYARSCSIGAESVKQACAELIQASERKDKDNCSLTLYWTKHRFSILRSKLETLVKAFGEDGGKRVVVYLKNMIVEGLLAHKLQKQKYRKRTVSISILSPSSNVAQTSMQFHSFSNIHHVQPTSIIQIYKILNFVVSLEEEVVFLIEKEDAVVVALLSAKFASCLVIFLSFTTIVSILNSNHLRIRLWYALSFISRKCYT
ncbi:unnamed protein product [Sphenostylis stenocarpa]|uniref:Histidine-containing phosphotransfer protein n=1 Tax=Sphenostylis stenocarpa TaxID=92480 RepID=A0AA86W6Q9_9FABA|nr:unnamed protein product [Sphenostylis stenocarpa]